VLVPPSPILAPLAFFGAFPFDFTTPFRPIAMPSSRLSFIPHVVIPVLGIIIASLAAFLTPALIVVLCEHCGRK
jgi:hypothetical protein